MNSSDIVAAVLSRLGIVIDEAEAGRLKVLLEEGPLIRHVSITGRDVVNGLAETCTVRLSEVTPEP